MDHSSLAERLGRYLHLTDTERTIITQLEMIERAVPRGSVLRAEHAPARELFVVQRGWLYTSMLLPDGGRQILTLHLPGDLIGDASLACGQAPFTISAATDAAVGVIDKPALRSLFETQPRIAMLLHALSQIERVVLADRLASVGRTSARARVAALIVDAMRRLRTSGEKVDLGFPLPLTQEEIGDATGLTAVHVNRMMRRLVEDGLVVRANGRVRVLDEPRLARIGHHIDRYANVDTSWLPSALPA